MLKIILGLVMSFITTGHSTPIEPEVVFEIESLNGKYLAILKVVVPPKGQKLINEKHTLYIYQMVNDSQQLWWNTPFEFSGYYGGSLSNNGMVFCYIDFRDSRDTHVVLVNKKANDILTSTNPGGLITIKGLKKITSHKLIHHEGGLPTYSIEARDSLMLVELVTQDQQHFMLDANTITRVK